MRRNAWWAGALVLGVVGCSSDGTQHAYRPVGTGGKVISGGALLEGRDGHAVARVDSGQLLVVGGATARAAASDTLERYDPSTGWSDPLRARLSTPRVGHQAIGLPDGRVWIVGGADARGKLLDTTELFDPTRDALQPGPRLGHPRAFAAAAVTSAGLLLAGQSNELDFRGFDSDDKIRKAVMLFYGSFGKTPQRTSYVPPIYREVVERIYSVGNLPREVIAEFERHPDISAGPTRLRLNLRHETGVGFINVDNYGEDFLESLQEQVKQLRMNRFELILVVLPLSDPATSFFGSGLQEIGLSFSGIYPEYANGDVLVLQNLNNVEIRPEEINVASEMGEFLRDFVLADYRRAGERVAQRERSRAHMARIYEALD